MREGLASIGLRLPFLLVVHVIGSTLPLLAQIVPLGPEFQVNGYTPGAQLAPAVASDAQGGFVVVWSGERAQSIGHHLLGRRFGADGSPAGGEFFVTQSGRRASVVGEIGMAPAGEFVVVWGETLSTEVMGRRFDSDGSPLGPEFAVSEPPPVEAREARIGVLSDGAFVVVWSSYTDVVARRYDLHGNPLGEQFSITGGPHYFKRPGSVRVQPDDDFVVGWSSLEFGGPPPGYGFVLSGRRFDEAGDPAGPPFEITPLRRSIWQAPLLDPDAAGNLIAFWPQSAETARPLFGRRFTAVGEPSGPEFPIESHAGGHPDCLAAEPDGGFTAAWTGELSTGGDDSEESIQVRHFPFPPAAPPPQFQVNTYTSGIQRGARCARLATGDLVVVWESAGSLGDDDSETSIQARLLRLAFFADGFETGDASRWSSVGG